MSKRQDLTLLLVLLAIVGRLSDSLERSKLLASGTRYLVAVQGLTDKGVAKLEGGAGQAGVAIGAAQRINPYVDVLTIDIQEGCLADKMGVQVSSDSHSGVILVLLVLPIPYIWPSANTEAKACGVLAEHVADELTGPH